MKTKAERKKMEAWIGKYRAKEVIQGLGKT